MRKLLVLLVVAVVGGYFGAKLYIQHKVSGDLDTLLKQMQPFVDASYDSVTASFNGELAINKVSARFAKFDDPVSIDAVRVVTPGFFFLLGWDSQARSVVFPERIGLQLDGLRASVDADFMRVLEDVRSFGVNQTDVELTAADLCAGTYGFTPESLHALGYSEMVVDLSFLFRRSGDNVIFEMGTDIKDMYDLDVALTLAGMSDPTALARGVRPLLVEGRMDNVDRSLHSRIIKNCEGRGVKADEAVAALVAEMQTTARANGLELDDLIMAPYIEFLLGKERFTVTSKPPKPVDLSRLDLYKPSDVPNLLNLVAEAH